MIFEHELNGGRLLRNEQIKSISKGSQTNRKRAFFGKEKREGSIKESISIEERLLKGLDGEIGMARGKNAVDNYVARCRQGRVDTA